MEASVYAIPGVKKNSDYDYFLRACEIARLHPKYVMGKTRKREVVEVRQVTMSLIKLKNKKSHREAAGFFNQDHATSIHSIKTVKNLLDTDLFFCMQYDDLFKGVKFPKYK